MQSLEHELIEKFRLLDKEAQKRVRALMEQEIKSDIQHAGETGFDYDAWFRDVEDLHREVLSRHGSISPSVDVVALLRDIRDGEDE
jgi:hypothetical protein